MFWKEELYSWMKDLALFYLLFSVFLHLVPDQAYERYIRFFMGIILILMICSPLMTLLGKGEEFLKSFESFYTGEKRILEEQSLKDIGEQYLKKSYEEEMQRQITATLLEKGFYAKTVELKMTDTLLSVFLLFDVKYAGREAEILNELERKCGITSDTGEIRIIFDESETVGDAFSDRRTPGDSIPSDNENGEREH